MHLPQRHQNDGNPARFHRSSRQYPVAVNYLITHAPVNDMATKELSPDTEATVFAFLESAFALERGLERALSLHGISFSEYRLLRTLSAAGTKGQPRTELASAVGLTPSAITRALKPLEKLGYVSTSRNERDARQSLAVIARNGQQLLANAQKTVQGVLMDLPFNALSHQQIVDFQRQLKKLTPG